MPNDPTRRPRERQNEDIEQDTGSDQRVPRRDGETERTVGPEDEDRRVRPGVELLFLPTRSVGRK